MHIYIHRRCRIFAAVLIQTMYVKKDADDIAWIASSRVFV